MLCPKIESKILPFSWICGIIFGFAGDNGWKPLKWLINACKLCGANTFPVAHPQAASDPLLCGQIRSKLFSAAHAPAIKAPWTFKSVPFKDNSPIASISVNEGKICNVTNKARAIGKS